MKKILTFLFVSILTFCLQATVFAEEGNTEVSDGSQGTVELFAQIASRYTVKLPRRVDVGSNSTTFNIFAKGSIAANQQLDVTYDDSSEHKLEDQTVGSTRSYPLNIVVNDGSFAADQLTDLYQDALKATFTVTHTSLMAGNYRCDLPILISLHNAS